MSQGDDQTVATRSLVLVVENEPILRMDAADMVEDAGFRALEAIHADEALKILESRADISVVITDVDMPGSQNGVQFATLVRERWPEMGIILISGRYDLRQQDLPARSVFFAKPWHREAVAAVIREMTGRQHL